MSWIFGKTGRLRSQKAPYKSVWYTREYHRRTSKVKEQNKLSMDRVRVAICTTGRFGKGYVVDD